MLKLTVPVFLLVALSACTSYPKHGFDVETVQEFQIQEVNVTVTDDAHIRWYDGASAYAFHIGCDAAPLIQVEQREGPPAQTCDEEVFLEDAVAKAWMKPIAKNILESELRNVMMERMTGQRAVDLDVELNYLSTLSPVVKAFAGKDVFRMDVRLFDSDTGEVLITYPEYLTFETKLNLYNAEQHQIDSFTRMARKAAYKLSNWVLVQGVGATKPLPR